MRAVLPSALHSICTDDLTADGISRGSVIEHLLAPSTRMVRKALDSCSGSLSNFIFGIVRHTQKKVASSAPRVYSFHICLNGKDISERLGM